MTQAKTLVTVSRHWNNPQITSVVDCCGIRLSMSLENYLDALIREMAATNRWVRVHETEFRQQLLTAGRTVEAKFKEESAKVV